mmetsp:Transcript_3742/g.5560  ORF Transcript_3742/g.5560 Transcript_3742/m.5560 type:complete len:268 (+) Transcript_3742:201-1004(+)
MSKLGCSVDELESNFLGSCTGRLRDKSLSESNDSLLWSWNTTLNHNVIFVYFTIMRESTHRSNSLLGKVCFSASIWMNFWLSSSLLLISHRTCCCSNTVDLFVDLRTVMVSILTCTSNRVLDTCRVPGSNTSNLTKTTMGLTWQTSYAPTSYYTFVSLTLGNSNYINHLILVEYRCNWNLFLKKGKPIVYLCSDILTSVDLDFHHVSLLLMKLNLLNLSVCNDTNNLAVFFHAFSLFFKASLSFFALDVTKCFFLASVPVLVEATFD